MDNWSKFVVGQIWKGPNAYHRHRRIVEITPMGVAVKMSTGNIYFWHRNHVPDCLYVNSWVLVEEPQEKIPRLSRLALVEYD